MIVLLLAQAAVPPPAAAATPVAQTAPAPVDASPAPLAATVPGPADAPASAEPQTAPATAVPASAEPAATPSPGPAAVITARRHHAPGDPFERFNRHNFARQQKLDKHFFHPVAMAYKHVVPAFLRGAIRHIFSNLSEPVVFLNYLLQLKPGKAAETLARFTINTGLGLGGAIDLAKSKGVRLPHRPNGFGDTLGYYGVKPGPYLFLPFFGPGDLRDIFGGQVDGAVLPLTIGKPYDRVWYQVPRGVLTGLDERVESDDDLHALLDTAVDPYATLRSVFLQDRAGEIAQLHGHPRPVATPVDAATSRTPELNDPLADPAGAKPAAPTASAAPELSDPLADPATPVAQASKAATPAPPSSAPELQDPLADPAAAAPAPPPPAAAPTAPARR